MGSTQTSPYIILLRNHDRFWPDSHSFSLARIRECTWVRGSFIPAALGVIHWYTDMSKAIQMLIVFTWWDPSSHWWYTREFIPSFLAIWSLPWNRILTSAQYSSWKPCVNLVETYVLQPDKAFPFVQLNAWVLRPNQNQTASTYFCVPQSNILVASDVSDSTWC